MTNLTVFLMFFDVVFISSSSEEICDIFLLTGLFPEKKKKKKKRILIGLKTFFLFV